MHVAFNAWYWDRPDVGSGQYLRRLVTTLRKIEPDLQITLVLPPHTRNPESVPDGVAFVETGNSHSAGKFSKVWFEQRTFPKYVKKLNADIAHIPYWGSPLSCSAKIVVSVLDVIPLLYPEYSQGFLNRLYVSLVSTSARAANHVITLSEVCKLDIEEHLGIAESKITPTYLAPDEVFHPQIGSERDEEVRQRYDLPNSKFVLYLGGFDRRKQVNELLLAYTYVGEAEGDNIPLVIAGKEPDWGTDLYPDLRAYAEELNITDYVHWIGYVEEEDKPSMYRLADVFVYPSEYEGFGLPPLEAMASGTPVIVQDIDVFAEILEDGAFLVTDARKLAGAIIALLLQRPFHDAMVNQGLALVSKYSWRKTAKDTMQVYRQVISEASE